ncbi:MAG TPA: hypothetical protein VGK56_05455 [Anaerolineales bacterium]
MPRIEFRGKTYNNEFEMPPDVRQAYRRERERRAHHTTPKPLTDIVDMPPEVRAIYERALGNVEENLRREQRPHELPKTDDIYRQSAPDDMKHLPSDESIYRPSQPLTDLSKSVIEPESAIGMRRFISSIVWALILVAVAFLIMQFFL